VLFTCFSDICKDSDISFEKFCIVFLSQYFFAKLQFIFEKQKNCNKSPVILAKAGMTGLKNSIYQQDCDKTPLIPLGIITR
jgi:hypothetical protein